MGGKTSKSTQTVSIPPEVLARYNAVNARAETAANTPFKQYGGEFVAGLTGAQRSGISNINAAANMAQPYFGAAGEAYGAGLNQGQGYLGEATGYARAGGQNVNASDINGEAINKYMSPYLQSVLQGTAGLLNQQNQQAMSGQTGNAIRQGAFGGDRGGIAAANLQQQQRLADSSIFSNILNQGYNTALNTAVGQQGVNLAAEQANRAATQATADRIAGLGQQGFNQYTTTGQNVQGLGAAAQNAAIQGGQAQMGAGAVEQATNQALDTAKYNQFKEEQSYPFQTAQFLSNIAQGTGALSGSTTTTAQPGGFFSDARLKENIQKVGKTYDGQHIYRYNYKGDPTTQIGLIAQEVEHHHPDAVGSAGHYRTVDYDKATDHAADRGHFYAGGLASMGGGVGPMQAGQGFAEGGLAGYDPAYMAELYKQLYAAGTGHGINGMQGIPVTPAEIHELMVAKGLQGNQTNNAADAVNAIDSIGKLGNEVGVWHGYGEDRKGHALGGDIEDPEAKKQAEEAGLAKAALEASKPEPQAGGLSAPAPAPTAPVKIEAPKADLKFGDAAPSHKLAVANAPVKPTNHGSQTIDDIGKLVQIGASLAGGMNQGGRIHRDLGGAMPYANTDSIVPQQDAQQHQLMTAQGTGGGGNGTGKAIGQIAGLASSLIPGGGIVKKGLGLVGKIFSDERMKENIRPIGELFDGQKVHSFNYKGDPRTQIGLIAQEVEHHSPHAIDHDHGMKTVDYHDATQHAAHRGHFAEGGMPDKRMNEILASLRNEVNPMSSLSALAQEQDMELRRNLYPDNASAERLGGLRPMPPAVFPKGAEKLVMGLAQKEAPKPGLTAKVDNSGSLPTNISAIAQLIRLGEGTGQNRKSSAYGPYQMIDSTFASEFRKNYPNRATGMSDAEIIDLKRSPEGAAISEAMGPRLIANNAKIVERSGFEPDAGNVYLAHFVGPETAVKLLRANPNDSLASHVGQKAVGANPMMQKNPTVGSFVNAVRGYMVKQADYLNREHHAEGGLAGRHGYAGDGEVRRTHGINTTRQDLIDQGIDPDNIPFGSPTVSNQTQGSTDKPFAPIAADIRKATDAELTGAAHPQNIIASGLGSAKLPGSQAAQAGTGPAQANSLPDYTKEALPSEVSKLAQQAPGKAKVPYNSETNHKFFPRLFHGETDAVLSALKGIAAMGAAPTRSLGVALATGLGEGAEAYQGQREFGRQLRETSAVEANVAANTRRAAADVATAEFNLKELPGKIAGWRQIAQKGGPNAALAAQTAATLQGILDRATNTLSGGLKAEAPSPAPVDSAATEAPAGGLNPPATAPSAAPTAASGVKPGTVGNLYEDLTFQSLAGIPTGSLEKKIGMAEKGYLQDASGNWKQDPTFTSTQLAVEGAPQRQRESITTDVGIGRDIYNDAIADNVTYQKAWPIIKSLKPLGGNEVPTTGFLSTLANAFGSAFGYTEKEMAEKFGTQPNTNSILNAAAQEGIPVDPSLGVAGVNTLLRALNEKAASAYVRAEAAKAYVAKNGYRPGIQAYIDATLKANGLTP
jgi:hypothetical protein